MQIAKFRGGVLDTNAFVFDAPEGKILVDAPQGADKWIVQKGWDIRLLLLTHAHFDHVIDAAKIRERFGCPVAAHEESRPMMQEKDLFRSFGFELEIEPVELDRVVSEGSAEFLGLKMEVFYVPGHSPGSLCFFEPKERVLFGGDVLFAGGIGRWDLPGGDGKLLIEGIKQKLFPLGDDVVVYPGHGPKTTIGEEKLSNPDLE